MKNENLDGIQSYEYEGESAAYFYTDIGPTGIMIEYKFKFISVGQLKYEVSPGAFSGPCDQLVIIIPPQTTKEEVLRYLDHLLKKIKKDGLYVGEWQTDDDFDPYHLFDIGGQITGIPESKLEET